MARNRTRFFRDPTSKASKDSKDPFMRAGISMGKNDTDIFSKAGMSMDIKKMRKMF